MSQIQQEYMPSINLGIKLNLPDMVGFAVKWGWYGSLNANDWEVVYNTAHQTIASWARSQRSWPTCRDHGVAKVRCVAGMSGDETWVALMCPHCFQMPYNFGAVRYVTLDFILELAQGKNP